MSDKETGGAKENGVGEKKLAVQHNAIGCNIRKTEPDGGSKKKLAVQRDATGCNIQKTERDDAGDKLQPPNELQQRQLKAMEMLLQGQSDAQVAKAIGVNRVTVYRWRRSHSFATIIENYRQAILKQSINRLQLMLEPAIDQLQRQIHSDDPKACLRATALLLRVASPLSLQRAAQDEDRDRRAYNEALDRINAPLPGRHRADDEDDDDALEDEDQE